MKTAPGSRAWPSCDYYGVTADFLLGRTGEEAPGRPGPEAMRKLAQQLRQMAEQAESYI